MKRLIIFAGYDENEMIDDYVIFLLKTLHKCADIIYVADCEIIESELDKIRPYTLKTITKRHGEYDFGSYKRGYIYAKENKCLEHYDYLIFCNDSVYGPLFNLCDTTSEKSKATLYTDCNYGSVVCFVGGGGGVNDIKNSLSIIEIMESRNTDVWGLFKHAQYKDIDEHLQSYFIAMTKQVFLHKEFNNFIMSIKQEKDKWDIIKKYEIGLSALFKQLHFTTTSLLDSSIKKNATDNPNVVGIDIFTTIQNHFPFLKKSFFKFRQFSVYEINKVFKMIKSHYEVRLILNHLEKRVTQEQKKTYFYKFSKFNLSIGNKFRIYSEYSGVSHKYHIILILFGKKIFTISPFPKSFSFTSFDKIYKKWKIK